jgi:hypothetical protein
MQGCANTSLRTGVCRDAASDTAEPQTSRVHLLMHPARPAYYLFSSGYFILITQSDALEYLETHSDAVGMGGLLPVMSREAPITSDTDLLSFALKEGSLIYSVNLLVAGLLEGGRAAVIDIGDESGRYIDHITVRKISNRNGDFRRFCTPGGGLLFSVVDEIALIDRPGVERPA